jgi:hypothetical protein
MRFLRYKNALRALVLQFALLVASKPVTAQQFEGALVLGSTRYSVNLAILRESQNLVQVELSVSQSKHQVAYAVARVRPSAGTLTTNGLTYDVPPAMASLWWRQLTQGDPGIEDFACQPASHRLSICETPTVTSLMAGVPAKARLERRATYRSAFRTDEIRLFSLEEWDNLSREYVSVGLSRSVVHEEIR